MIFELWEMQDSRTMTLKAAVFGEARFKCHQDSCFSLCVDVLRGCCGHAEGFFLGIRYGSVFRMSPKL